MKWLFVLAFLFGPIDCVKRLKEGDPIKDLRRLSAEENRQVQDSCGKMTDPGAATVHVAVENLWDEVVDCTGVLISPRHVITSPYCFFDVDSEFINADPKLTFVSHGSDDSAISLIFKEYPHSPPPGVEVKGKPSLVKVSHITLFFEEDAMDYHNFLANASKSSLKPMDLTFTEIAILQLQEDIRGNDKLCIQKDFAESIGEHKRRISYFGYDKDVNGTKTHIWRKSGEYQLSKDKCDEYPTKSLKKACENSLMVVKDFATDFDFRNRFRLYGTEGAFFTEERSGRHTAVAMLTHRRNRKEGNKYQATAVAISPAMRVICVYAGVCAEQSVYDKKDTIWAPHVHIDARGMREELSYDIRRYKNIDNNRDEFGFTVLYSK